MISRFRWPVRLGTLLAAMLVWGLAASAQGTLQADLEKQYTLTKMGTDSTGDVVVSAGKVLVLQKGGVLGVPYNNMVFCPSHYQDGNLKPPNTMCKLSVAKVSKYINSGEKVYVTHIDIIPKDEKVIFSIVDAIRATRAVGVADEIADRVSLPEGIFGGWRGRGASGGRDRSSAGGRHQRSDQQQQAAAPQQAEAAPAAGSRAGAGSSCRLWCRWG